MNTKLHHHHTIGFGMAMGLPLADAIERMLQSARDLDESANKLAKERDEQGKSNFGQRIAAALASKLQPRAAIFVTASKGPTPTAEDESFGQKIVHAVKDKVARVPRSRTANSEGDGGFAQRLKEATEKKSGAKRHKEYAERERDRYEQQRQRAKGA
jgi:hypothetical protein